MQPAPEGTANPRPELLVSRDFTPPAPPADHALNTHGLPV
jgi:hypothetical protein